MGSGLLNVSVSGLNAAQMGILTTSHNISNASTPGFNRQQTVQSSNTPLFTGAGFLGQGASVQTVKRVYDEFLSAQVATAETNAAELDAYSIQIAQIDNLLADPSAGLSPALQGFFSALDAASANPSSVPARQAMLSSAQGLVSRFQGLDQQLGDMRSGVNSQIQTEVTTINSLVGQIADLNQRIVVAQASGSGQPANDLYDQRDQLISDLNKEIRVTAHKETDGSYSLFFGTGQPLVVGVQIYKLQAVPSREDLTNFEVGLQAPSGAQIDVPESLLSGGKLGGLLSFRTNTLNAVQNGIGRIAMSIANAFNQQHALGQDLQGDVGANFFQTPQPQVLAAPVNTGTGVLSASITMSDYQVTYNQAQGGYTITRLADDTVKGTFSTLPQVVDGIRISLSSGAPANGDIFMVRPGNASDARVTAYASNTGTATLGSSGSNMQTLTESDYRLTLTGTNVFTLERLSDHQLWKGSGVTQAAALADLVSQAAPQGFDLQLSGNVQINDSFLIRPTRTGARDLAVAVSDPKDIALGAPIRTSASLSNAGTATISPGSVKDTTVLLQAPFTVRYEAASQSLIGFPVGASVKVGALNYTVTDENTRIPYSPGAVININGVGATISGTPKDGDAFTFSPNRIPAIAPPPVGNTGFATLLGIPSSTSGVLTGGVALPGATTIVAGQNDQFRFSLDGGTTVLTATIAAGGPWTPAVLSGQIQGAVNTALTALLPATPTLTVTLNSSNQLVMTSSTGSLSAYNASNTGTGVINGALVTSTASLPVAPIKLTYHAATTSPVQAARLTGFPVGSVVTVTPINGKPTEYVVDQLSDSVPYLSGAEISFGGMSFSIKGPAVEGDSFMVGPNPSGVSDNRNAQLLGALQTTNAMADATATFQSVYSQIVSTVGNKAREVEVTLTAQQNLVQQGQTAIQSQSGVNLDEEAANLLRYQQAYQAAAKIINVSSKLFDELLSLGR